MRTLRLCAILVLGLALSCALDDEAMGKLGSVLTESMAHLLDSR